MAQEDLRFYIPKGHSRQRPRTVARPNGQLDPPWMSGTVLKLEDIWPRLPRPLAIRRAKAEVAARRLAILPLGSCTPADIWLATQAGVDRKVMMERGMIKDLRDPAEIREHKLRELEREMDESRTSEAKDRAERAEELRRVAKYDIEELQGFDESALRETYKREFPHIAQKDPDGVDALEARDIMLELAKVMTTAGEDRGNVVDLEGGDMVAVS